MSNQNHNKASFLNLISKCPQKSELFQVKSKLKEMRDFHFYMKSMIIYSRDDIIKNKRYVEPLHCLQCK